MSCGCSDPPLSRCPCRPSWSNWWEERRKRKEKEKHDQKFRDQEAAIRQRNRNALLKMPASAFQGAAAEHSGYLWKQGKGFWKRFDKRWFVLIPGEVPGTKMLLCENAANRCYLLRVRVPFAGASI